MNLGAVLVTGLFAGGMSCAAVQGGLLTGLVARQRAAAAAPPTPATVGTEAARHPAAPGDGSARTSRQVGQASGPQQPQRPGWARVGDDLVPVGAFLGGKLVSHALLGALLGAVGGAMQLSASVRVWTQLAAGALIIVFGLAQLGVGPFRRLSVAPPAAWSRFVRGRARSTTAFAPAVLGFFTILVPCGVTLSVEALALASGSPLSGAAAMAVFVVGTSPLFTVLGFAASKAATVWRGRLAVATGVVVLGMGLYTVNGGLTLADSPLALRNVPQTLGMEAPRPVSDRAVVHQNADGRQEVIVTARDGSYRPGNIAAMPGIPTTLVIRSQDVSGCVRAFVIPSRDQQWTLPENGDTRIDLGVLQPGTLTYTCAMGMYSGQLTITDHPDRP